MGRVARGGQDAFEILLDRYGDAVVTFCYAFLRSREAAEDIGQETFLRVYRSAARYKPLAKFTTWLYRIAANLCINELKKGKLRRASSCPGIRRDSKSKWSRISAPEGFPPRSSS